jgi:hypothetical protein
MFKIGGHDPFEYLKHKLWPKERSGVKLPIWLPTIKSWELPWFTCVQVLCLISLESSRWGLQLCFKITSIGGLHKKLWASKVARVPISRISRFPTWESKDEMTFGCRPYGQAQRILQGGRWWLPPSLGHDESCESMFAHGSSVHQKCPNYAITNLLFSLCRSMWIIDPLVTHPNPHPGAPTHPSTPNVLWARERTPTPYPSDIFTFGLVVESIKEFGGASYLNHMYRNMEMVSNFDWIMTIENAKNTLLILI